MAQKTKNKISEKPPEYDLVVKHVGLFMQYWGFKAVHGQIWACLFLADEPLDANNLMQKLKISKAAVSLVIKDLIDYKVIMELEKKGPSTKKYVSNPNLIDVICNVLRFREKKMLQTVINHSKQLSLVSESQQRQANINPLRSEQLLNMCTQAQIVLEQMLLFQDVSFQNIQQALNLDFE